MRRARIGRRESLTSTTLLRDKVLISEEAAVMPPPQCILRHNQCKPWPTARSQLCQHPIERLDEPIGIRQIERHRRPNLHDIVVRPICPGEDPFVAHPIDDI